MPLPDGRPSGAAATDLDQSLPLILPSSLSSSSRYCARFCGEAKDSYPDGHCTFTPRFPSHI
eukprot:8513104-Lingulodinium_polyedra.AAC.1